jgi:hypothetical protein
MKLLNVEVWYCDRNCNIKLSTKVIVIVIVIVKLLVSKIRDHNVDLSTKS